MSWLVALALGVRAAVILAAWGLTHDLGVFHGADYDSYLALARSLLDHGRFTLGIGPEIVRTPGYPLLLLPGVALGAPEAWGLVVNLALSAAGIVLVHQIAFLLAREPRAALVAALIYALEPLSILYAAKVCTETAFAVLVLLAVATLLRAAGWPQTRPALAAGALLGLAVYVRPIALVLPPVFAIGLALMVRPGRSRARAVGLLMVSWLAVVTPWTLRNGLAAGYWAPSAMPGRFLQLGLATAIRARAAGEPFEAALERARHQASGAAADPGRSATRTLVGHPLALGRLLLRGLVWNLASPGAAEWARLLGWTREPERLVRGAVDDPWRVIERVGGQQPRLLVAAAVLELGVVLVLVLALAGTRRLVRTAPAPALWLWLVSGTLLLSAAGPAAGSRFRQPVMPLLAVLAGHGLRRRHQDSCPDSSLTALGTGPYDSSRPSRTAP